MTVFSADSSPSIAREAQQETCSASGRLKIFFSYAAGAGKTYAMLKAAQGAKKDGIDVVVGYVEHHGCSHTKALLEGLEVIPVSIVQHNGIQRTELDLEAAVKRKPQLLLIDELAHHNVESSRHKRRYQDIQELLAVGIDVYTTVNVQHIESLCDKVAAITGAVARERIPDHIFDEAAQVELVDIEPQELMERLRKRGIEQGAQDQQSLHHFCSEEKLTALREIALRRCADRLNYMAENTKMHHDSVHSVDEHILVCLSSSPTNPKIIRTAARMARAFHGKFTALFVETPAFPAMSEENKLRLRQNIHLAEQLGASIETSFGEDVALQIAEFAQLAGASKVVLGQYNAKQKRLFSSMNLTEKLISYAPGLDIYIIPDKLNIDYQPQKEKQESGKFQLAELLKSLLIIVGASIIGNIFYYLGFSDANIIMVYILGALLTAISASNRLYSIIYSVISVLIFNLFFTEPRFSFNAYGSGYPVTFLIMLLAALITGNLAMKIKAQAKQSARMAYRTKVLFDTNQALQKVNDQDEIISVLAEQLVRLLKRDIVFYGEENGSLAVPRYFPAEGQEHNHDYFSENEQAVAEWVFQHNQRAGATTDTLSSARCLYLAIRSKSHIYGVIGIVIGHSPLKPAENSMLLSILGECAMALENEQALREKEQAAVLAKNEQLRANLLRAISHDLRTPLTSISGNAGILLASDEAIAQDKKRQLYADIYDDSLWLINLVENLLAVTRIEDGSMNLRLKPELMDEVIAEALRHVSRKGAEHSITVIQSDDLALAKMDGRLIVQVVINMMDNAVKYTPVGSHIVLETYVQDNQVVMKISDDGPGISDEDKPHVFDMFYTCDPEIADNRRSLGMGLALCKSIINAHGGEIHVLDNKPKGTIFYFTLPVEEVVLNE